jgi:hypothetical protein
MKKKKRRKRKDACEGGRVGRDGSPGAHVSPLTPPARVVTWEQPMHRRRLRREREPHAISRFLPRDRDISLSLSRRRESERSDPKENESGVVTTRLHDYSRFSILIFIISSPSQSSSPSSPDPSGGGVRTGLS